MGRSPAIVIALLALAGSSVRAVPPASAAGGPSVGHATAIDRGFQRLYNFDFPGAFTVLDDATRTEPDNALVDSVRAVTYLYREMARLHILETTFFLNTNNLVDGATKLKPDPAARAAMFAAIESAKRRANARLSLRPDDTEALFALCMAAGVETDYTGLVEGRTWRSAKLAPNSLRYANKLLAQTPPFYDAYLNFGAVEYIVGDLPFFVRWFVHFDGIKGNKARGIEELKMTAERGRYYGPFARILLVLVSLREHRPAEAEQWLRGLVNDFPENPLFGKELTLLHARS